MSGITDELINKVNMDYTEAAGKLKAGEIDALVKLKNTRALNTITAPGSDLSLKIRMS